MIAYAQENPSLAPPPTTSPRRIQIASDDYADEAIYVDGKLETTEFGGAYSRDIAEASGGELCTITFHDVLGSYGSGENNDWPESFSDLTLEFKST